MQTKHTCSYDMPSNMSILSFMFILLQHFTSHLQGLVLHIIMWEAFKLLDKSLSCESFGKLAAAVNGWFIDVMVISPGR